MTLSLSYEDFGAVGDGTRCDMEALASTHAEANRRNLPVRAKDGATYLLSGKTHPILLQTDTDFGTASFIVDDREVEDNKEPVFRVTSTLESTQNIDLPPLKAGSTRIPNPTGNACLVLLEDNQTKRYIRKGLNQNPGKPQTDILHITSDGDVNENTPLLWDFDRYSTVHYHPIDENTLTLRGGVFTTIANQEPSTYNYYSRGIEITRSNVVVENLTHRLKGEGETGAPYKGFLRIQYAADVQILNTVLTGHKKYTTIGKAGKPVAMGSYDITVNHSTNVSLKNVTLLNDLSDNTYWGIFASNFSKNLLFDGCRLSRFDAHMGVTNATILNSTMGHMGVKAIGHGELLLENTTVQATHMIDFRQDYGSTWKGNLTIRDCTFIPKASFNGNAFVFQGHNTGEHDFGYICHMPENIDINGLEIDVSKLKGDITPYLFKDYNPSFSKESPAPHAIVPTKTISLERVNVSNGKDLQPFANPAMFTETKVTKSK